MIPSQAINRIQQWVLVFFLVSGLSPAEEHTLRIGLQGTFQATHPFQEKNEVGAFVYSLLQTPLILLDDHWVWHCRLCTEVPSLANKRLRPISIGDNETLELSFTLSTEAQWDDGTPVTTDDLLFTWDLIKQAREEKRHTFFPESLLDIVVIDKRSFKFMMQPSGEPLLDLTTVYLLPRHLEKVIWDKTNSWHSYLTESLYVTDPTHQGLYNGPFSLMPGERGVRGGEGTVAPPTQTLLLAANLSGQKSSLFRTVNVQVFSNASSLFNPTTVNRIDFIPYQTVWDHNLTLLQSLEDGRLPQHEIAFGDSQFFEHVDFNLQNPLFRDRQLRQALAFAIDKDALISQVLGEWALPAISFCHPQSPYFSERTPFYDFSLKKAEALLSASEWKRGPDGVLEKSGRKLAFELWTVNDPLREAIAGFLAKSWLQLGVKVTIVPLALNRFREAVERRNFPGLALYALYSSPYQNLHHVFHSSAIPSIRNDYSGNNLSAWNEPRVDNLLSELDSVLELRQRKHLFASLQELYATELPSIPLFFRLRGAVLHKRFKNYTITPTKIGALILPHFPPNS